MEFRVPFTRETYAGDRRPEHTVQAERLFHPDDPMTRSARCLRDRFDRDPHAIASAPGRVNLIGEHVDHRGGVVLPFAIDRRTAVAVSLAADGRTTIVADDLGIEACWEGGPPTTPVADPAHSFANHVLGVVAALQADHPEDGEVPPLSIAIASDLPVGGGLSSSAALEVAVGIAVSTTLGRPMPDVATLARAAQHAEHVWVGTPCGVMDMLASAAGEAARILRIDCNTLDIAPLPAPPTEDVAIVLLDSGVRHRLADGDYADRLDALDRVETAIGRPLRETTTTILHRTDLDPVDARRARHVVTEMARVDAMIRALGDADLHTVGDLLLAGQASLRDDFGVSTPEIDTLVEAAMRHRDRGVLGARMTGGGFGGWVVLLARRDHLASILEDVSSAFAARFGRIPSVIEVRPSDGARLEATPGRRVSYPRGRSDA